ncbi:MAG TPA: GNAT family N-acetyltransferase [Anaerolineae bacterium]|nr:GNAT family N-acetyltransferase [Anaerolineae bacterium]
MEYKLRAATRSDLPLIVKQRHAMFERMGYVNRAELDLTDEKFIEWVQDKLNSGEYRGWFLEDNNGKLVAGAGLWLMEWVPHAIDQSTQRGNILNVYAEPEYRDRGILRQLLIEVLDFCRDNGLRTVIVNPSEELRPFYESLGFRPTGEMRIQLAVPN